MRITSSKRKALEGYLFVLPWIIGFLVFLMFPLGHSFIISFGKMISLYGFKFKFIGIENYGKAFLIDVKFIPIFKEVVWDTLINIPIILVFSLGVAYLVNQKIPGKAIFKMVFFLPVVIASGPVITYLSQQGGVAMPILQKLGIGEFIYAYFDPALANPLVKVLYRVMLVLWRSGIQILICLAGLQAISPTLYEAAKCDGANEWSMFWKITLPMLIPILELNAIYTIVDSFTDSLNPILQYIKLKGFQDTFFGYAAALGWIYFIFIFAVILAVLAIFRRYTFYMEKR